MFRGWKGGGRVVDKETKEKERGREERRGRWGKEQKESEIEKTTFHHAYKTVLGST